MTYLQRKKLAFMSIVNQIKGFVRSVFGVPPLTLPDCISGGLLNYIMDGNSVQNGTPAPENPVEVESVGEYDEVSGKYKLPVVCSDGKGNSIVTDIYLNEPLRKIGDYADCVDFENGIVRKTIYEKVLTEDNSWTQWDTSVTEQTSGVYYRSSADLGTYSNQKIVAIVGLSNYFTATPYSLNTQKDEYVGRCVFSGASNPPYIGFKIPFVTLDEWKRWLAEKNAEGNPLKVYWVWKEPTETPITLPKLPTFNGTTVYTIDTSIQPSNMSATYYATSKE